MKTVMITGANRGLGKEVARQLAQKGFRVLMTGRDRKKLKKAAKEVKESTGHSDIHIFELDMTSPQHLHTIASKVAAKTGQLDVLINNAGIFIDSQDSTNVSRVALEQTLDTNFYGPVRLTQEMLPLLRKGKNARIINVSSGMGALTNMGRGHAAYRISKTALNGFTTNLAADLCDEHILVVAVCPGWVKTDMGGANADRDIEMGGASISQLAWKDNLETGRFYRDGRIIAW